MPQLGGQRLAATFVEGQQAQGALPNAFGRGITVFLTKVWEVADRAISQQQTGFLRSGCCKRNLPHVLEPEHWRRHFRTVAPPTLVWALAHSRVNNFTVPKAFLADTSRHDSHNATVADGYASTPHACRSSPRHKFDHMMDTTVVLLREFDKRDLPGPFASRWSRLTGHCSVK